MKNEDVEFNKQYKYLEDAIIAGMEESEASEKAKELGLVHRGFGKYAKDKESAITHKTQKGTLVQASGTEQDTPKRGKLGGETEKEKEEKKHHVFKADTGLTDIKRIQSDYGKAAFSFRYNGKYNEMVFTKGEYALMVKKHISPSKIILARIKKAIQKKQAAQIGKAEKKALKSKEYQLKKKEMGEFEPMQVTPQVQAPPQPQLPTIQQVPQRG